MTTNVLFTLLILMTVGLNAVAQTLLKLGSGKNPLNFYLLGGLISYGLSTVFYIMVLGKLNLSVAYPVVIGLPVAATTFAGAVILQEKVELSQWMGIGLMISGIIAISLSKTNH